MPTCIDLLPSVHYACRHGSEVSPRHLLLEYDGEELADSHRLHSRRHQEFAVGLRTACDLHIEGVGEGCDIQW